MAIAIPVILIMLVTVALVCVAGRLIDKTGGDD